MTLRQLISHTSPDVDIWVIKDGCTDPSTFIHLTRYEARKEYINSNVEVKDFRIEKYIVIITI